MKKSLLKLSLLLLASFIILVSCNHKDDPKPIEQKLGTFLANIENKEIKDTANSIIIKKNKEIKISSSTYYPQRFLLTTNDTIPGTYICNLNSVSSIVYYDSEGVKYVSSGSNLSKIIIKDMDYKSYLLTGSFEGKLFEENGSRSVIVSGSFNKIGLYYSLQ
ncbi:DUF6252 family protein [Sporocytophaga myxococcoides]|uniref:DUF6252 family protein n=1 Tax=Sporocytophaga myxococcoides TaxID=153721 RepID=UPI000427679F|nr:DUF6252 family protein [Sporocytophaga myxococcoides]